MEEQPLVASLPLALPTTSLFLYSTRAPSSSLKSSNGAGTGAYTCDQEEHSSNSSSWQTARANSSGGYLENTQHKGALSWDPPQLWGLYSPTLFFSISINYPALFVTERERERERERENEREKKKEKKIPNTKKGG
jgi:hypothetical protein